MYSQLLFRPHLLCSIARSVHHLFELGAALGREALRVRFLKEPQLFKGNNRIAFCNLEVELHDS